MGIAGSVVVALPSPATHCPSTSPQLVHTTANGTVLTINCSGVLGVSYLLLASVKCTLPARDVGIGRSTLTVDDPRYVVVANTPLAMTTRTYPDFTLRSMSTRVVALHVATQVVVIGDKLTATGEERCRLSAGTLFAHESPAITTPFAAAQLVNVTNTGAALAKAYVMDATVDTTGFSCGTAVVASTVGYQVPGAGLTQGLAISTGALPVWVDADAVGGACSSSVATPVRVLVGDLAPGETRVVLLASRGQPSVQIAPATSSSGFYPLFDDFTVTDLDRWTQPNVAVAGARAAYSFSSGKCRPCQCLVGREWGGPPTTRMDVRASPPPSPPPPNTPPPSHTLTPFLLPQLACAWSGLFQLATQRPHPRRSPYSMESKWAPSCACGSVRTRLASAATPPCP
jgi:hypothetical protein